MKNFTYLAAVSVVVLAQAASAQVSPAGEKITNQAVTLKIITPRSATAAASVTLANGVVWSFDGSGNVTSAGATVAGVTVAPGKLTAGMSCVLNGTRTPTGNTIATLACDAYGEKITNQAVTLKVITPRSATAAASVTLANGVVWSFDGSGNVASAGVTVAGVAVAPGKLAAGMSCVLNGTRTPTGNTIATLAGDAYGEKITNQAVGEKITNQAVTLKVITPRSGTTAASVTLKNGVVWSFDGSGNVGATVAGVSVVPGKLTAGMSCVLNGTRTPTGNTIDTLAC